MEPLGETVRMGSDGDLHLLGEELFAEIVRHRFGDRSDQLGIEPPEMRQEPYETDRPDRAHDGAASETGAPQ
ncbi:MAG TPA: hypothetical protein VFY57_09505 [Rubrobacteraceae bacterium]|nr:hypothetical protein [Rubrobacteraceae bacterium]